MRLSSFAALTLFALAVRLVAASSAGPMNDEAFTAFLAERPVAEILTGARPDNNPPGYYVLLHPLAGTTRDVLALRLPSLLAGVGAVLLTALAGLRLGVGWGPALILACAYPIWLADCQIRQYGLILLATTGALLLSLRACTAPPGRRDLWLYGLACAGLPLLSYGGFLAVGSLAAAALVGPGPRRVLAAVSAVALLPGLAWLGYAVSGPGSDLLRSVFAPPTLLSVLQVPAYLTGVPTALYWAPDLLGGVAPLAEAALGCLLAAAAALGFARLRAAGRTAEALTLALAFLLPLASLLAVGFSGAQAFQPRYLVPQAPALLLLVFAAARGAWVRGLTAAAVALNLGTVLLFPARPFLWNQDWATVARWIQARQASGDRIAVWRPYSLVGLNFSYAPGQVAMDFREPGQLRFTYGAGYTGLPQSGAPAGEHAPGRLFLVLSPTDEPGANEVIGWANERYAVVDAHVQPSVNAWGRIAVYLLVPK